MFSGVRVPRTRPVPRPVIWDDLRIPDQMNKHKAPVPERRPEKKDPLRRPKPVREPQVPAPDRGVVSGIAG